MSVDLEYVIHRALARRQGVTRSEIRDLALRIRELELELVEARCRVSEAEALAASAVADMVPLKNDVETLRQAISVVESGLDESATLLVDARLEVARARQSIENHGEWQQRAMRVVTAAKEWQRNSRSDRALGNLRDAVRSYGADA